MKLIITLLYIIFNLTLGNALSVDEECQIYYSIIGENDGSCSENSNNYYNENYFGNYAILKNGHITEL